MAIALPISKRGSLLGWPSFFDAGPLGAPLGIPHFFATELDGWEVALWAWPAALLGLAAGIGVEWMRARLARARDRNSSGSPAYESDQFFELSVDLLCIAGTDGYFKRVNRAWETTLGFSRVELYGKPFLAFVHPDDQARTQNAVARLCSGHAVINFENRYVCRDGSYKWLTWTGSAPWPDRPLLYCVARDITERKLMEEAVRSSEARFRTIFENAGAGIKVRDLRGQLTECNALWTEMIGYTKDELSRMWFDDYTHPDDLATDQGLFQELLEGRRDTYHLEKRFIHKSGRVWWGHLSVSLIRDLHDVPQFTVAVINDITNQKEVEAAYCRLREELEHRVIERTQELLVANRTLRTLESWQRTLIDAIQGIVWECSAKTWLFTFVSPQAEAFLGYPVSQWLDQPDFWQTRIHPDDREWVLEYCAKMAWEKTKYTFEYRIMAADGRIVWLRDIVTVERDQNEPVILRGIMVDITDSKQAEQALRESEERLRQAVRVGHIGIFDHDHLTDFIYWSPEKRQMFGWGTDEPISLAKCLQQVHPEDFERITEAVRHAHDPSSDGTFDVEYRIIDRHGVLHWLSTRSRTFFEGEGHTRQKVRTIGAVADITERKQTEQALRRTEEELRKAMDERQELAEDLHDNIIQTIYAVALILEQCRHLLRETPAQVDQRLEQTISYLNQVIVDVRHYIVWATREEITGDQLCTKLTELAKHLEGVQGVRFSLDLVTGAAKQLTPAQAFHILYIVQEAVSNSLRHSQCQIGLISLQKLGDRICVEIRDDGVGFIGEDAGRPGQGLRNMTIRAQKLGGTLRVVSRPGLGTQILVEFPQEPEDDSIDH